MNPRHATANTTTKYIAVKTPTLMRSFPVSLPPVFDVEADAFPVVFMCEPFPVRLFSRRAFYEVSYIQQQSILANTHRAATPNSRACSKRPHVLQDGRVRFTTARDGAATAWGSSRTFGETPRRTLRCARIPPRALRAPRPSLRSRAGCKRLTKSSSAIAFTVSLSENGAVMISSACSTIVRSVRSASSSVQVRERVKRAVAVSSAFAWKYGAASGNAARSGVNDLRMARTSAGGPADPSARIIASASPESSGNLFLRLSK